MKTRVYILFSLIAHTLITFAGQQGMATMGIILYYNFLDSSEMDRALFLMPSIATTFGYVLLVWAAWLRHRRARLWVWILATGMLLGGSLLLFTRNPEQLNYKVTLFSAIPYAILSGLAIYRMLRKTEQE